MTLGAVTQHLMSGLGICLKIFFSTAICASILGMIIAFGSMSKIKPLRAVVRIFVWIIRGTPLMLQLIIIFYGPGLIGAQYALGRMSAVYIAFAINYACYFSEIFRGGIEAIPNGQYEAGQVLGMTRSTIFFRVVLLQVVKRILPPMGNELITLVKDTSLARIIAVKELTFLAQEYIASNAIIWPLFYSAVFYLAMCGILTLLLGAAERKLSYFRV